MISKRALGGFLGIMLSLILGLAIWTQFFSGRVIIPGDLGDPVQVNLKTVQTLDYKAKDAVVKIDLLAEYKIDAVVKGVTNYNASGLQSAAPMDFILIWGDLNQDGINNYIRYSQFNRWYSFTVTDTQKVAVDYVAKHSANTHMIPADDEIAAMLKRVHKNDYVSMEGYLVKFYIGDSGITSSLSRDDSGAGACEVFYVTKVRIQR